MSIRLKVLVVNESLHHEEKEWVFEHGGAVPFDAPVHPDDLPEALKDAGLMYLTPGVKLVEVGFTDEPGERYD